MRRTLVMASFRCVELEVRTPEEIQQYMGIAMGGATLGAGVAFAMQAMLLPAVIAGLSAGMVVAGIRHRRRRRARAMGEPLAGMRSIDVVPWGIVMCRDGRRTSFAWRSISEIGCTVSSLNKDKDDRPRRRYRLKFATASGELAGTADEQDQLALLPDVFKGYARVAARPVALDLEGATRLPFDVSAEGPAWAGAFAALRARAQGLLASREMAALLTVPTGGYRSVATRTATPELVATLRGALEAEDDLPDRGPLAAILAAELSVKELLPELLDLVMSPHPLLSTVGKAAARRLGAAPVQTGAIREVEPFLPDDDLRQIEGWAAPPV